MIPAHARSPLAPLGVLATSAALLVAAVGTGRGQPPEGAVVRKNGTPVVKRIFISAETCAQCHTQAPETRPGGKPLPRLVLRNEYKTWEAEDKHGHAFDALKGDRGKAMGTLLGFADVSAERACLSCHATGFERDDPAPEQERAMDSRDLGVGCTSCHGPYREWVQNHFFGVDPDPAWRNRTPEVKYREFGMTDLRDPARRAEVCASCHVGNAGEGKVVTHAMYAAGHPPLPAFEVASFLKTMPAHWAKPEDVAAFKENAALRKMNHIDFSEPQATRDTVIGGVAALRDAMRLLAGRAEPDPEALPKAGKNWPDYAQLECYACHHDLRIPEPDRGRQFRGFDHHFDGMVVQGVPGRPQFRPWPLALARLAIAQTGTGRDAYRDAVKDLYAAFDARPFGDPARVSRAAKRLADWSDEMIGTLQATHFDAGSPRKLLVVLTATPAAEVSDFDSARQVAWAFQEIYSDWKPRPRDDAQIAAILAELDRALKLNPYASREPRARLISSREQTGDPLRSALLKLSEDEFRASITRAADFDPIAFQDLLKRLGGLLSAIPAAD